MKKHGGGSAEFVAAELQRQWRETRVVPGELLPSERELATGMGVSRPMIREAIRMLQAQGWLEVEHGVGARFSGRLHKPLSQSLRVLLPADADCLLQLNEFRRTIEPAVARLAAQHADPAGIAALHAIHATMTRAKSGEAAAEADIAFHHQLALMSRNRIFALLLDTVSELGRASRRITIRNVGKNRALQHHARILNAVAARAPEKAAAAMQTHIDSAIADLKLPPAQEHR